MCAMATSTTPLPLFDSIEYVEKQTPPNYLSQTQKDDFSMALSFLKSYIGSIGTFNSYRLEVERLLQWCSSITNKNCSSTVSKKARST